MLQLKVACEGIPSFLVAVSFDFFLNGNRLNSVTYVELLVKRRSSLFVVDAMMVLSMCKLLFNSSLFFFSIGHSWLIVIISPWLRSNDWFFGCKLEA